MTKVENTEQTTEAPKTEVRHKFILGLFNGMLAPFQTRAYGDMVRAGIAKPTAHMIADAYGASLGQVMKSSDNAKNKINKAKDNGESMVKLSVSGMVTTRRDMSIIRLCQTIDSLFEESLLETRSIPPMNEKLAEFAKECTETASKFDWFESKKELEEAIKAEKEAEAKKK